MDRWVWAEDPGKRRTQRRGQRGHLGLQGPVPAAGARLSPRAGMKAVTVGSRGRSQGHGQQVSREQSRQGGPGSCVPRAGSTGTDPKAPQAAGGQEREPGAGSWAPVQLSQQLEGARDQTGSKGGRGEKRVSSEGSGAPPGGDQVGQRLCQGDATQRGWAPRAPGTKASPGKERKPGVELDKAEGSGAGSGVEMLRPRSPRERGR